MILVLKSLAVASVSWSVCGKSPVSEQLLFHLSWLSTFGRPSVWFDDVPNFPMCLAPRAERKKEWTDFDIQPSLHPLRPHKSYCCCPPSRSPDCMLWFPHRCSERHCGCHSPQAAIETSCGQLSQLTVYITLHKDLLLR